MGAGTDMRLKIIHSFTLTSLLTLCSIYADTVVPKSTLKSNGMLFYNLKQKDVERFSDMFQEGEFYGRLRNNNFFFSYDAPDAKHDTHLVSAFGASIVYKSASLKGFDMSVGLYGSHSFFNDTKDPLNRLKPAKDTLSRFDYTNTGNKSMGVVGQAYISYKLSKSSIVAGRQLVETFYTKSNDTKMNPNTFDGVTFYSGDVEATDITLAYLYQQKLRDHLEAHSVLMVGDANLTSAQQPQWSQNDDSAMHKGLTYTALKTAGKPTQSPLIVFDVTNKSIENLKINFASYVVPELLSQAMGELNYKFTFGGVSVTPGIRYLQQFDNGAGRVGGASLGGLSASTAYKNPFSLDSKMVAARVVTSYDQYKVRLGYTNILDEADLVTPWRSFPTAGYTRSMGMYNWRANTKSYRVEFLKNANAKGFYKDIFMQISALYIDGDITKDPLADSMFYYAGFIKNLESIPELQYKLRLGYRDFVGDSSNLSSYLDSRLEFNYLF